jgi:hypothetical protein
MLTCNLRANNDFKADLVTTMTAKIAIFWVVTFYSTEDFYHSPVAICCFYLQVIT